MGAILSYSLVASITLLPLYLVYKLLLARETFHQFNRIIIMCNYLIAVIAGVLSLQSNSHNSIPVTTVSLGEVSSLHMPVINQIPIENNDSSSVIVTLIIIYVSGLLIFVFREMWNIIKILRIISAGKHITTDNGWRLVLHNDASITPFSWVRYIVMSQDDYQSAGDTIVTHELMHLQQRHWIDLMIAELFAMLTWYNPASWLMIGELQTLHEYQADAAVLKKGIDAHTYQILLIKKAVGSRFPSIANSLNHSTLKKRITMMLCKKSNPMARWRAIAVMPLLVVIIIFISSPAIAGTLKVISDTKVMKNSTNDQTDLVGAVDNLLNVIDSYQGDTIAIKSSLHLNTDINMSDIYNADIYLNGYKIDANMLKILNMNDISNVNVDKSIDGKIVISLTQPTDILVVPDSVKDSKTIVLYNDKYNRTPITNAENPVIVVDERVVESIDSISPNSIESIQLYKGDSEVTRKYNATDRGVMVICIKK